MLNLGGEKCKASDAKGHIQGSLFERKRRGLAKWQVSWPSHRTYLTVFLSQQTAFDTITSVSQIHTHSFLFAFKNKVPKGFFSMTQKACRVTNTCDSSTWSKAGGLL